MDNAKKFAMELLKYSVIIAAGVLLANFAQNKMNSAKMSAPATKA